MPRYEGDVQIGVFPNELWVVIGYSDFSESKVFDSEAAAREYALAHSAKDSRELALYSCDLVAKARPQPAQLVLP